MNNNTNKDLIPQAGKMVEQEPIDETLSVEDKYPHLTALSNSYKRSEILNKEVKEFLNQSDAGYESVEQAFKCGAHFGMEHAINSKGLVELDKVVEVIQNKLNKANDMLAKEHSQTLEQSSFDHQVSENIKLIMAYASVEFENLLNELKTINKI